MKFRTSKGQSAIEYLTTYGWMLLVVAIVGGAVFTTVQGGSSLDSSGFDAGSGVAFVEGGLTSSNSFQMALRNQEAEEIQVEKITLTNEEGNKVVARPDKTLPVGEEKTFNTIGLAETSGQNSVNVEITYDSGGLDNLAVNGSITGAFSLDTEQAEPGNGEWVFVDVSEVNQSTVDTSGMSDFYIMKYEASRSDATDSSEGTSDVPASQQGVVPWTEISMNYDSSRADPGTDPGALEACEAAGFNLPSNRQWQAATMAEIGNESSQPLGNTNNNEDSNGDQGTIDPTSHDWNNDGEKDRTLTGSGPDTWANTIGVHDLNGNVWEWTSTVVDQSHPMHKGGSEGHVSSWNNNGYPESLGSSNSDFGGDYYWSSSNDTRAVRRGGYARSGADAGVFSMILRDDPSGSGRGTGFRCSLS
ncbi:SUMF1/EgtB/PvdO family nonheme iron enzyme [Candidatus Nanohalobium constans]|uniref:Formylglycine-generating enzyme, required for sulfatase activity, contains SUMF1/FGE domain n=1 Tax=Candidatus Nanohalobium constans TaxID=2565781 RepID=A0A5Q0UEG0_9ARCH|nr:SUMF1/EgtB/PvdO family nonheme iron enzyme [Candidatus Nanohalobium constans]QGA79917.1 formylglycine-generating enzyme, required for sulfatase activity, contains SUMF1/FGE domain [Candidatus Nanohalobium constans]